MIHVGDPITADVAEKWGLVARVFPEDQLVDKAVEMAQKIASHSKPIGTSLFVVLCCCNLLADEALLPVAMAKEVVNKAEELPLNEGVQAERRVFFSTFATNDQKEGMKGKSKRRFSAALTLASSAFINKQKPKWTDS